VEPGLLPRFFGRAIRRTFGDLALDDAPAATYLTDLLTRFARAEALHTVRELSTRPLATVFDALLEIQRVWEWESPDFDPGTERVLRRHIGDYTLFMTGIFRDHVERLAVTGYYQREGQRAYRFVAETARTGGQPEAPLFRRLADRFEVYSGALAYARKVHFRSPEWPADPFHRILPTE
jgi:hypothetical protein